MATRPADARSGAPPGLEAATLCEAFQRSAEVTNSLSILAGLRSSSEANKETLQVGRRANGVLTHHDAVSGTSEWYVVLDYGNVRSP